MLSLRLFPQQHHVLNYLRNNLFYHTRLTISIAAIAVTRSSKFSSYFFIDFRFFRAVLGSQQNGAESMDFPYTLSPHTFIASPIIKILHQSNIFVTIHHHFLTYKDLQMIILLACSYQAHPPRTDALQQEKPLQ